MSFLSFRFFLAKPRNIFETCTQERDEGERDDTEVMSYRKLFVRSRAQYPQPSGGTLIMTKTTRHAHGNELHLLEYNILSECWYAL